MKPQINFFLEMMTTLTLAIILLWKRASKAIFEESWTAIYQQQRTKLDPSDFLNYHIVSSLKQGIYNFSL